MRKNAANCVSSAANLTVTRPSCFQLQTRFTCKSYSSLLLSLSCANLIHRFIRQRDVSDASRNLYTDVTHDEVIEILRRLHAGVQAADYCDATPRRRRQLCATKKIEKLENVAIANALQLEAARCSAVPIRFNTSPVASLKSLSLSAAVLERIYC